MDKQGSGRRGWRIKEKSLMQPSAALVQWTTRASLGIWAPRRLQRAHEREPVLATEECCCLWRWTWSCLWRLPSARELVAEWEPVRVSGAILAPLPLARRASWPLLHFRLPVWCEPLSSLRLRTTLGRGSM